VTAESESAAEPAAPTDVDVAAKAEEEAPEAAAVASDESDRGQ
jgi:hypothetical protein